MFELTQNHSSHSGSSEKPEETKPQEQNFSNKRKFQRKPILTYPYVPVAVYFDARIDNADARENIIKTIYALLAKGYTVRLNGDDGPFYQEVMANLPVKRTEMVEAYIPWKPYDGIESNLWYSANEIKDMAKTYFNPEAWEKIPKGIQARLGRNIRMLFGSNNTSCCVGVVTWTPDGAETLTELGRETGTAQHILKAALSHAIPVININSSDAAMRLATRYNLG